jgi:regulatory protein
MEELNDSVNAAYEKAVRILAAASQTRYGLEVKLKRAGFTTEAIKNACEQLEQRRYLDDKGFAKGLASKRIVQGKGRMYIRQELKKKGIAPEIIENIISTISQEEEQEKANIIALGIWENTTRKPSEARKRKVLGTLGRRGYSGSIAFRALAKAIEEEDRTEDA